MIQIDQNANGRDVHLCVGDELKLTLPENQSSGYRWELVHDPGSALCLVENAFEPGNAPRPGSPGARHWIFKAREVIRTTLEFQSKRSWGDEPSTKTFSCNVVIERPVA